MSRESSPRNPVNPLTLVIAGLAMFGLVMWWALRDTTAPGGAAATTDANAMAPSPDAQDAAWPAYAGDDETSAGPSTPDSTAAGDASQGFAAYVGGKYKYLTQSPKLSAALLVRERIAVEINTAKQSADESLRQELPRLEAELAEADRKVGELLAPRDVAGFEVLKDSDMDQFQFEDYVGGISNVTPLAEEKREAILYAKLANRQRFRQVLETSGLMRGDLTASQRQSAFQDVSRALRESRDGFLQEARQHMHDEEQFTLLSNYENSEYSGELDKLRRIADGE